MPGGVSSGGRSGRAWVPTTCLGASGLAASPGSCSHLPGSLPAGLRPESGPSHLGPETAAADPDQGLRTVCGCPQQGLSRGPRPHSHRCVRTCASIPASVCWSLGVPTSGQAGGPCSGVLRLVGLGDSVVGARRWEGLATGGRVGWGRYQLDSWTQRPRLAHSHVAPVAGVCPEGHAQRPTPLAHGRGGEGRLTQSRVLPCSARAALCPLPSPHPQSCPDSCAVHPPSQPHPLRGLRAHQRRCPGWRHTDSAHRVASHASTGAGWGRGGQWGSSSLWAWARARGTLLGVPLSSRPPGRVPPCHGGPHAARSCPVWPVDGAVCHGFRKKTRFLQTGYDLSHGILPFLRGSEGPSTHSHAGASPGGQAAAWSFQGAGRHPHVSGSGRGLSGLPEPHLVPPCPSLQRPPPAPPGSAWC